jgi:hypothetical protein
MPDMQLQALGNTEFLRLWEQGSGMHPLDRALLTIGAALPEDAGALADWPLGRRNAALADLRRRSFGSALSSWCACPECGERMEFELDAKLLCAQETAFDVPVRVQGRALRLPTSRDLASIAAETDPQRAALHLLQRCCLDALEPLGWTEQQMAEAGQALAEADPLAETLLKLRCAVCSHEWQEPLDIADYLWSEIEARARRLLIEVHSLASAYGWSEADILALSEPRRRLYLDMVQA